MNLDLIKYSTEDLLVELRDRFSTIIVLGVDTADPTKLTEVYDGPAYAVAGLLQQGLMETMASIQKQIDQAEE